MTTGERIRAARKRAGLTQKQLAERIGVKSPNLSQLENGKREPQNDTLRRIAEALEVDPYSLVSFDDTTKLIEGAIAARNYLTDKEQTLLDAFDQLNEAGQDKAVERVQELTDVPKYRADIYNDGES